MDYFILRRQTFVQNCLILVKVKNAREVYEYLMGRRIIVRDRSKVKLCDDCLRITVGTPKENEILINSLKEYK